MKVWVLSKIGHGEDWFELHKVFRSVEVLEAYVEREHVEADSRGEIIAFSYEEIEFNAEDFS